LFEAALKPGTPVIHQPDAVADAMERYLYRHPEFPPGDRGLRRFLTTGEPRDQNGLAAQFWGSVLRFEAAA
jgi:glutamate racemase